GLASVYGIVKQSQGEIEAESTPGLGTRFRIRWPRVELPLASKERRSSRADPGQGTVLLVDDDDAVPGVGCEHLRGGVYVVMAAASGADALVLLERHLAEIALLVSDVSMPGMSGFELVLAVRERARDLPVLLISGYADELVAGRDRANLRAAFLPKPFSGE